MRSIQYLLVPLISNILLLSCDEDIKNASDIAIFITPGASTKARVCSGDIVRYDIDMYTTHEYVKRLKVESFDSYHGVISVKDTTWDTTVKSIAIDYVAPSSDRDSLNITLTFTAWDNAGNKCEAQRTIIVKDKQILIAEKSGIVLWNGNNMPDALSFNEPDATFCIGITPDSAKADMYIKSEDNFSTVSLYSNTKSKFVRNNSFNYPAATARNIINVFSSSRADDVIYDLRINDIILVGHGTIAEGAFIVSNIIRTGNNNERCMQLSFKSISNSDIPKDRDDDDEI